MPLMVTETHPTEHSSTRERAYGFEIKKRGSGSLASEWPTILELVYATEAEAQKAEQAIRAAVESAVHAEGSFSGV
ncbi:hypothetical protein [Methylocystis sp.]|uniref:hypothetical protein n=1 Tax=Methylocystis sp. TaxID=1911079 RepID=UPI0025F0F50C|nr:hypothetical protein [Methylocystis sp.]